MTLGDRALDRAVAERLGYTMYHYDKDVKEHCYYMLMTPDHEPAALGWHDGERRTEEEAWMDCPRFSSDIAAAFEVEEEIARRDRQGRYVHLLGGFIENATLFDLIHASPEMRCQAALQALEEYTI